MKTGYRELSKKFRTGHPELTLNPSRMNLYTGHLLLPALLAKGILKEGAQAEQEQEQPPLQPLSWDCRRVTSTLPRRQTDSTVGLEGSGGLPRLKVRNNNVGPYPTWVSHVERPFTASPGNGLHHGHEKLHVTTLPSSRYLEPSSAFSPRRAHARFKQ